MYNRNAIRTTTWLVIGLIAATAVAGGIMIVRAPVVSERPELARVEYRFIGTASRAAISFLDDEGRSAQREITPPGSYRFRGDPQRDLLIEIRRLSDSGAVGCAIIVNSKVQAEVAVDAGKVEATCRAKLP